MILHIHDAADYLWMLVATVSAFTLGLTAGLFVREKWEQRRQRRRSMTNSTTTFVPVRRADPPRRG